MNTKPSPLVHLARSPKQAKSDMAPSSPGEQSAYGYGLSLDLNHEQTQALGMTDAPPVGSTIHATVKMHVNSASSQPTVDGGKRNSVGLTVTHMKVHGADGKSTATPLARAKGSAPAPKGKVAVAAHIRRAPAKAAKGPRATHSAFVRPPTVKRA